MRGFHFREVRAPAGRSDTSLQAGTSPLMTNGKADQMVKPKPIVFLVDVDNTLLDNDAIQADTRQAARAT